MFFSSDFPWNQVWEECRKFMLQHITSSHNPPLRILVTEALHTRRRCQQQNPADISKGYQDVEGATQTTKEIPKRYANCAQCTHHLVHSSLAQSSWTIWIRIWARESWHILTYLDTTIKLDQVGLLSLPRDVLPLWSLARRRDGSKSFLVERDEAGNIRFRMP